MAEHDEPRMIWELRRGDEVLAQLVEDRLDWPWMHCDLLPSSRGWMEAWQTFTESATSDASSESDAMRQTLLALDISLHLVAPPPSSATDVAMHYLVHIGPDGRAWFRYSDAPNVRNPRHPSGA